MTFGDVCLSCGRSLIVHDLPLPQVLSTEGLPYLRAENVALRAEVSRLRAELDRSPRSVEADVAQVEAMLKALFYSNWGYTERAEYWKNEALRLRREGDV